MIFQRSVRASRSDAARDRKSTRLNSSHSQISYAVFCLKKKKDISYDFVTRPGYHHALVTGDAEFLRLILGLQKTYQIDPSGLISALHHQYDTTLDVLYF